jgi:hypothetical protein
VTSGLLAVTLAMPRATLLHRLHSGHVGDYVAWLVVGVTMFGLLLLT